MMDERERLIVALDVPSFEEAEKIVKILGDEVIFYKVGLQLYTSAGPQIIKYLKELGKKVFLDLKLHDIPSTVAKTVSIASYFNVDMMTIHTLGGFEMMEVAQKRAWKPDGNQIILLGVTILTSLDQAFLKDFLGVERDLKEEILQLASLAKSAGLSGVVASPNEVRDIKLQCGEEFIVVTPGIRPEGYDSMEHARSASPKEAIIMGADYIVVGRPIVQSRDPLKSAREIQEKIRNGLSQRP